MTPDQIAYVRTTWALMATTTDEVAELFYRRLFELDPGLRVLFAHSDMEAQGDKLIQTLTVITRGVEDLPRLLPAVAALGRRHVGYGVLPSHYATVGEALLSTFEQLLGDAFPPPARDAWASAIALLADVMIAGSEASSAHRIAAADTTVAAGHAAEARPRA